MIRYYSIIICRRTSTLTGTAGGPSAAFSPAAPELPSDGALFAPSPAEGGPAAAADSEPSPAAESVFAFFGSGSPEDVDGPAAKAALSASAFLANSSLKEKRSRICRETMQCSNVSFSPLNNDYDDNFYSLFITKHIFIDIVK